VAIRVVLFDIDGTLVLTGGAGARAMLRTFEDVFGPRDPSVEVPFAGRTDTWIISELARRHGYPHDGSSLIRFRDRYLIHLAEEIVRPGPQKGVLPGVRPLLETLAFGENIHLGLLTGNFEGGARIKLEYFDLWKYFACGAFAEDAADRNGLFAPALSRLTASGQPEVHASEVAIVGDTPLDIDVARSAGARSVAVATGSFSMDALRSSGADSVLADLSDRAEVLAALDVEM
jgi:phosphoglycolate phosphatase-like HAD superfamily hydrolase